MIDAFKSARPGEVVFHIGTAGSGKTRRCVNRMRELEAAGRPGILLVPEQSTYLADRQILEPSSPAAVRHARVASFRRLATLLAPSPGITTLRPIDASGRRILLRSILSKLDPDVSRPLERILHRSGFTESLVAVLRDLRTEGGPEEWKRLQQLARESETEGGLAEKLRALAAIAEAYDRELLARGLRDPEQALAELPELVRQARDRLGDTEVEVDGFLSFTRIEAVALLELARAGASLSISFCVDPEMEAWVRDCSPPPPSFRLDEWPQGIVQKTDRACLLAPLRTLVELRARLRDGGLRIRVEPLRPNGAARRFRSPDLALLEERIFRRATPVPREWADLEIVAARDPSHEVEIWAKRIDSWLRHGEPSVRPGEIAVIVRDLETYRPLVERSFARWGIPLFVDRHWDLSSRPAVRAILDGLEVIRSGWQRTSVIAFLRCPLLGARGGEIDLLENLSIEAGYDFQDWKREWTPLPRPPRTRFVRAWEEGSEEPAEIEEEERDSQEDPVEAARVRIANRIMAAYLAPLLRLEQQLALEETTGSRSIERVREWIEAAGLRDAGVAEEDGDRRKEWEAIDHVLSQIAAECAEMSLPIDELVALVKAGLDSLRLGRTPTGLDRVTLAEVQRSRLGEVRRAVLGGLSAGTFPRIVAHERFFNESERKRLAGLGIHLGPPDPLRQEEEAYFFYIALTRASERLLITRPASDLEGDSIEPSPFVREALRAAHPSKEATPAVLVDPADLSETQTVDELSSQVGAYIASRLAHRREAGRTGAPTASGSTESDRRILTVYNRLLLPPFAPPVRGRTPLAETSALWGYDNRPALPPEILSLAFRDSEIAASVSRLESFARCPYQHFAKHLLRIGPRPRARVTPIEAGLLTHRALEALCGSGEIPTDPARLKERVNEAFRAIEQDESLRAFEVDPAGRFRRSSVRGQLLRFLAVEAQRVEGSMFKPERLEQEFGTKRVAPLIIDLPGGGRILLRGRIDRIDTARSGDTVEALVLDYKSRAQIASDRGRPANVRSGFDLQLAVYLMVVEEVLRLVVAGALYAPVLPRPAKERTADERNPLGIKLVGLVPEDLRERVSGGLEGMVAGKRDPLKTRADLEALLAETRTLIARLGRQILDGRIDIAPTRVSSRTSCEYCDFASLCRFDPAYNKVRRMPREGLADAPALAPEEKEDGS